MAQAIGKIMIIATLAVGCKPVSLSQTSDAATTSTFRTGFFAPRLREDFATKAPVVPLSPHAFLEKAKRLTRKPGLTLWKPADTEYAVTATSSGEQILLILSGDDIPAPVMSLAVDGRVYAWGPYVKAGGGKLIASDLFVRFPYRGDEPHAPNDAADETLRVENMFVRRMAKNSDGFSEPVLVPWGAHVASERGNAVVYRIGNTVMDARSQRPALEFRRIGEGPAWAVVGPFKDGDVEGGTVFFKTSARDYLSITKGAKHAVVWRKQDADSMDRVTTRDLGDVRLPTEVANYLDTLPDSSSPGHPSRRKPEGFDWLTGDAGVIQLDRNDATFGRTTTRSRLSLSGSSDGAEEKSSYDEQDYTPTFALDWYNPMTWWGSSNKPLQKTGAVPGSKYGGAVYTDESGSQRAGVIIAERNDPNAQRIYTVLNRTTNQVQMVNADGTTRGSPISQSDYVARANGTIDRMETMRSTGELAQAESRDVRSAQGLDARAQRQLVRSQALVAGDTVKDMAGGMLKDVAVSAATFEARSHITKITGNTGLNGAMDQALVSEASRTLVGGAPTTLEGAVDHSQAFLFDTGRQYGKEMGKRLGGEGVGEAVGVAADTGRDAYRRWESGDFSTTNPDYEFDSQVSMAGVAGTAVSQTAGSIVKMAIPPGIPGRVAAGVAMGNHVGNVMNSAEAYSRASYADTLSTDAGAILDQRIEMRQTESAYRDGLDTLMTLEAP